MANYTANAYGADGSRKPDDDRTSAAKREPKSNYDDTRENMRFKLAAGSQISGGEIWVNKGTTIAAGDTFTITVQAG